MSSSSSSRSPPETTRLAGVADTSRTRKRNGTRRAERNANRLAGARTERLLRTGRAERDSGQTVRRLYLLVRHVPPAYLPLYTCLPPEFSLLFLSHTLSSLIAALKRGHLERLPGELTRRTRTSLRGIGRRSNLVRILPAPA